MLRLAMLPAVTLATACLLGCSCSCSPEPKPLTAEQEQQFQEQLQEVHDQERMHFQQDQD